METQLINLVADIKKKWRSEGHLEIGALLEGFAKNETVLQDLENRDLLKGEELYKDKEEGFVLYAYTELKGTYRIPHNHGNGWVIYVVLSGAVEMGIFKRLDEELKVTLVSKEVLKAKDWRLYLPGDIHDTNCLSERAIILRLTSCDLKQELQDGRMLKFEL